jgi:putative sigma-54 modulation protein
LGKNLQVTEGMREHFRDKLVRLEKYAERLVESHVVLKKEKRYYEAEITLLAKHFRAFGDGRSKDNIFTAIDEAYVRVEKQLKRFREKIKGHHVKETKKNSPAKLKQRETPQEWPLGVPDALSPEIIRSAGFSPKPMTPDEASLQLHMSGENFVVFLNPKNGRVNVLYKREDGDHGLIEPER